MGLLGQQTHPDVVARVHRTFAAVRAAGRPVGVNAFDPAVAQSYLDAGATFVLVGADVAILARGTEALAARFGTGEGEQRAWDCGSPGGGRVATGLEEDVLRERLLDPPAESTAPVIHQVSQLGL